MHKQRKATAVAKPTAPDRTRGLPARYLLEAGGLLRLPQVLAVFPVSKSTFWAGVRAGRYPQPVKLGTRCTAWHSADIAALIESTRKAGAQ